MPEQLKIVLFEDTADIRENLLAALRRLLDGTVVSFEAGKFTESQPEKDRMYEDRLKTILGRAPYENSTIIVADRDLSKSKEAEFGGLSVNSVAAAARELGIPLCSYARQPEVAEYEWSRRWEEGHILLRFSEGIDAMASRAVLAAKGFAWIAEQIPGVLKDSSLRSPAKLLATLLGKPEFAEKIALYSVGDQNRLAEILDKPKGKDRTVRMMAHFLGYWLWDSLLRYPGLFVNEVAAASYLNIDTEAFRRPDVQAVFSEALYKGPFSDDSHKQWWRGTLEDIVARDDAPDGLALVRQKVSQDIDRSKCSEDPNVTAGYYCIISNQPVSFENSKGGLSWFPRGADLTRISNKQFEEYGPWLGA